MAAGQQKKRLISPSLVRCNIEEQHNGRKKKYIEPPRNLLNMTPHISLVWDDSQKRAVAKREQIGVTWRDMAPFVGSGPQSLKGLADVFPVPQEIFELENLTEVLSYEAWKTHLSQFERKVLAQFLPKGTDVDQAVRSLLSGDNLHFGNLFLTWGTSLCSGDIHPDAVLLRDQFFRASKRAYYKELEKYHKDVLENLQILKDKWTATKDPDIVENKWRNGSGKLQSGDILVTSRKVKAITNSRKEQFPLKRQTLSGSAKYMSYIKINRKQHQLMKSLKQSSDGIKSNSLNQVLGDIKRFGVRPYESLEEEEKKKLRDHWLQLVTKDLPEVFAIRRDIQYQRQQIKKSLECELLERKRCPVAKVCHSYSRHLHKLEVEEETLEPAIQEPEDGDTNELYLEEANLEPASQEAFGGTNDNVEEDTLEPASPEAEDGDTSDHNVEEENLEPAHQEPQDGNTNDQDVEEDNLEPACQEPEDMDTNIEDVKVEYLEPASQEREDGDIKDHTDVDLENSRDDDPIQHSPQSSPGLPLQRIPSLNSHHEPEPMVLDSNNSNEDILKEEPPASNVSEKREDVEDASAKDMWQDVTMPDSYYSSTSISHEFTSAADLTLGQPQPIEGRHDRLIDLETDILEQEDQASFLHAPHDAAAAAALHIHDRADMFPGADRDQTELLPSFLKEQRALPSYPHDNMKSMNQHGLNFMTPSDCTPLSGQFQPQFQDHHQPQLIEQRQIRDKDMYMHPVMHKNLYSNGRYPNQEFFPSPGMQDWPSDPVRAAGFQSSMNSGLLNHNWYSAEPRALNSWSGVAVTSNAGQCLGQGSNADGSLYSVLSQCNSLQSHSSYSSINSDLHVRERNFVSGTVSGNGDILAYSHQLNYLNSGEVTAPTAAMKTNNVAWMNLPPNSSSSIHDSVGKQFLRPWSQ